MGQPPNLPALLVCLMALGRGALGQSTISTCSTSNAMSAFDFQATAIDEKTNIDFSDYRGKVLIVVNVATY